MTNCINTFNRLTCSGGYFLCIFGTCKNRLLDCLKMAILCGKVEKLESAEKLIFGGADSTCVSDADSFGDVRTFSAGYKVCAIGGQNAESVRQ